MRNFVHVLKAVYQETLINLIIYFQFQMNASLIHKTVWWRTFHTVVFFSVYVETIFSKISQLPLKNER